MTHSRLRTAFGLAAALGLLGVAACGSTSTTTTKPQANQTLTFGTAVDTGAGGCDGPQVFAYATTLDCAQAVEEPLVSFDFKNNTVTPDLATSWSESVSGTLDTVTFHLRQNVKFSDGTPFNADAVVFNLRRVFDKTFAANGQGQFVNAQYLPEQSVTKINDSTVAVAVTAGPNVIWDFAGFADFMQSPTAVQAEGSSYDLKPVGTGPYKVVSYVPSQRWEVVRNPLYWGTPPNPGKIIEIIDTNGQTLVNDLLSGTIDAMQDPSIPQIPEIKSAGYGVTTYPSLLYWYYFFNVTRAPFNDPLVRQAAEYAIDKESVSKLSNGVGSADYGVLLPGMLGYDPNVTQYKYDTAMAGQLLDQAGWTLPAGGTVREKNGQQLTVSMWNHGSPGLPAINNVLLVSDLEAVGFKVTTNTLDAGIYYTPKGVDNNSNAWNLEQSGEDSNNPDPSEYLYRFTSAADAPVELHVGGWTDPMIDQLWTQQSTELNAANRLSEVQQMQTIIRDAAPMLWFDQANEVIAFNPKTVVAVPVDNATEVDIANIVLK